MALFTDGENDAFMSCANFFAQGVTLPVDPLEPLIEEAPSNSGTCLLKTAAEAIYLYDMFASFLSAGERGNKSVIAVAGGFGTDKRYHVIATGNAGQRGVFRPRDELCAALAQACKKFISGKMEPPNPAEMSEVLIASLDICHLEVAKRLQVINTGERVATLSTTNANTPGDLELWLRGKLCPLIDSLKECLEMWETFEYRHKTKTAALYGQLLGVAPELWGMVSENRSPRFGPHVELIRRFSNVAKGLRILRAFPCGTDIVFDWPQGPKGSDPFICQPALYNAEAPLLRAVTDVIMNNSGQRDQELRQMMQKKHTDCRLHCEIYLALHILFSDSDVSFDSFLVAEERKRVVFPIGCSKASCVACWDILLELSRQDQPNGPILVCRTQGSHGKCYGTWGPPRDKTLPPSLLRTLTRQRKAQMVYSLTSALRYSHQKFEERVSDFGGSIEPWTHGRT
jgi:hypothetical protein